MPCSEGATGRRELPLPFLRAVCGDGQPPSLCRAEEPVTRDAGCSGLRLRKCR